MILELARLPNKYPKEVTIGKECVKCLYELGESYFNRSPASEAFIPCGRSVTFNNHLFQIVKMVEIVHGNVIERFMLMDGTPINFYKRQRKVTNHAIVISSKIWLHNSNIIYQYGYYTPIIDALELVGFKGDPYSIKTTSEIINNMLVHYFAASPTLPPIADMLNENYLYNPTNIFSLDEHSLRSNIDEAAIQAIRLIEDAEYAYSKHQIFPPDPDDIMIDMGLRPKHFCYEDTYIDEGHYEHNSGTQHSLTSYMFNKPYHRNFNMISNGFPSKGIEVPGEYILPEQIGDGINYIRWRELCSFIAEIPATDFSITFDLDIHRRSPLIEVSDIHYLINRYDPMYRINLDITQFIQHLTNWLMTIEQLPIDIDIFDDFVSKITIVRTWQEELLLRMTTTEGKNIYIYYDLVISILCTHNLT